MSVSHVFGFHAPFLQILYRSAIIYIAVVLGIRLTGRRQLGQMTPFDLVLILLIANAVQNAMVGTDVTIFGGLVAAAALLAMNQLTGLVISRVPFFRTALEGQPILLVNNGHFISRHVAQSGITEDLIMQAVREHGFDTLDKVQMAVLEIDGTISIVPADGKMVRTRHRVRAVRPGGN